MQVLHETLRRGEFATGVIYVEPDKDDFITQLNLVDEPLAALPQSTDAARPRPSSTKSWRACARNSVIHGTHVRHHQARRRRQRRRPARILPRIEEEGFTVRAMRLMHMTKGEAEGFYAVHQARPFFGALTDFMSSGPCIVMALEAPDAIRKWRTLMGATDPAKAEAGTLRKEFGESIERNATHGSDAPETAAFELGYFFRGLELVPLDAGRRADGPQRWSSSASSSRPSGW